MKNLNEIKKIINEHRLILEERFKVKNIGIFGSYVRGEQKEKSDVDIIVEFKEPVSILHIVSLENYLSDILGIKADVIPKRNIRKELENNILKETIFVWSEVYYFNISGMRDKIIHSYFSVDFEEVWLTVKEDIPKLKPLIKIILEDLNIWFDKGGKFS